MALQFISEKGLEKINFIFTLMNELSDSSKENYIPKMMKRYKFISKVTNYSIETIRKMFFKTKTYCHHRIKDYSYKIYYYDVNIYLLLQITKEEN